MVFRMKNYTISEFNRLDKTKLNGCYRVDGVSNWYKDGKLHREDGPAVRLRDGKVFYYFDNVKILSKEVLDILVRNKDNILPCSKSTSDEQYLSDGLHHIKDNQSDYFVFIKNGRRHNDDGPAFICDNVSYWKNGKLHREDGPAVECDMDPCQYFLNGIEYNKEEFYKKIMNKNKPSVKEKVYTAEEFNKLPINERTGCLKHSSGEKRWFKEGKYHREDGPAIEYANGDKEWYKEGKLHREEGPACEYYDGTKKYWLKDVYYSSEKGFKQALAKLNKDKPVIKEKVYTVEEFFKLPVNKRTGCVKYSNGDKRWIKRGKLHRLDGPAYESINGSKYWYKEGKLHREDGPAIESANKIKEWWFNGEKFSESEFKRKSAQLNKKKSIADIMSTLLVPKAVKKTRADKVYTKEEFDKLPKEKQTGCIIYPNGNKFWYKEGKCHREDGPASEFNNGKKEYWLEGFAYSEKEFKQKLTQPNKDKPAVEGKIWTSEKFNKLPTEKQTGCFKFYDESKRWYKEGNLHREDGPAVEFKDGNKLWYLEGYIYTKEEYNSKLNNEKVYTEEEFKKLSVNKRTGCVKYANGDKRWFKKGELHREDGPAIEYADGEKR